MLKVQNFKLETDLVPSPIKYKVLLPPDYETSGETYPLMLALHGGGGDQGFFNRLLAPIIEDMWERKLTPKMVLVMPKCKRCLYMDYRDRSQKWETFIINELLPHLRNKFRVIDDPQKTFIGGVSMGGLGSLRMGFKNPDKFGAIASFEPGIEPAFEWKDVKLEDKFYRDQKFLEKIFGSPIDEDYWKANNPSYILTKNAIKIRESGIKIYLEVGTDDMLGLFRGTELIHRLLFENNIRHEYRLVYGADHVGNSLQERLFNGFSFLNRVVNPAEPDPLLVNFRKLILQMKENMDIKNS